MPDPDKKAQQLHASNISADIGEALEARVKDPLWFLARQWQTGEFEAENGGRLASLSVSHRDYAFRSVTLGGNSRTIAPADPLEALVEAEDDSGDAPAWRAEALEYGFTLTAQRHKFEASGYDGRFLDWRHFDYAGPSTGRQAKTEDRRVTPTQLYFRGAPHPRWWRMEDAAAYFDSPADPEPNVLSMLLPEFFYTDIDNWYIAPLPMRAGALRQVTKVEVVDSFGVTQMLDPATGDSANDDFALFALDPAEGSGQTPLDGSYLFVPNIAVNVLENDEVEDVRFIRDEDANLVWAWEHRIVDEAGNSVSTGGERVGGPDPVENGDNLPRFVLKSETARHWIPYVPRQNAATPSLDGQTVLRRGRSDENANAENPQYRSRIVTESKRIFEEEVPATGLRIRRIARYARGADGTDHFWVGRSKEAGNRTARPGLRFDYLDE